MVHAASRADDEQVLVVDTRRLRRRRLTRGVAVVAALALTAAPAQSRLSRWWDAGRSVVTPGSTYDPGTPHALSPGDPPPVEPSGVGDVDHLTPAVRRALDRASKDAAAQSISLQVTSGWRSPAKQQRLFDEAITKYGSPQKARRWVLPPEESEHVKGRAVDVAPRSAARWLEQHGVRYGLCRRYANEPWHFELLAPHRGQPCPPMAAHA